jgi:hypothetical protein
MRSDLLHIVTAVSNPIRWKSRIKLATDAIEHWLRSGAKVHVVECATGERPYELDNIPGVHHIPVRSRTVVWNKENLINIGISRLPQDAKYIGTFDADVHFRNKHWAAETVHALQLYPVVQPWQTCYDLGPDNEHMQVHTSFASQYHAGRNVIPSGKGGWTGPYAFPHPGYAWAWTRSTLDRVGGLFEVGGMGSGDHHMALALVGRSDLSLPGQASDSYREHLSRWEKRAVAHVNGKIGFVHGTIEHMFHGRKQDRKYVPRWQMFMDHNFDPVTDLKKNTYGVVEFAGNKPELELAFDRYLRSRDEDINSV